MSKNHKDVKDNWQALTLYGNQGLCYNGDLVVNTQFFRFS